jgi:hypothetical protein
MSTGQFKSSTYWMIEVIINTFRLRTHVIKRVYLSRGERGKKTCPSSSSRQLFRM